MCKESIWLVSTFFDLPHAHKTGERLPQGQAERCVGGGRGEDVRERGRHLSWVPSMFILYKVQNHTKLIKSINVRILSEERIQTKKICALITVAYPGIFKMGALDETVAQSHWGVCLSGVRLAGLLPSHHPPKNSPLIGAFSSFFWACLILQRIMHLEIRGTRDLRA